MDAPLDLTYIKIEARAVPADRTVFHVMAYRPADSGDRSTYVYRPDGWEAISEWAPIGEPTFEMEGAPGRALALLLEKAATTMNEGGSTEAALGTTIT